MVHSDEPAVTITIDADDPRSIRAVELAAQADHWLVGRNAQGMEIFGVPSQRDPNYYYIVTDTTCSCADYRRAEPDDERACKHILAVRLHRHLVRAQAREQPHPPPRTGRGRGHLAIVHPDPADSDEPDARGGH